MEILKVVVFDLLASAPILVGIIALTGLLLQKQPADKVISGTLKTIVGFLVFGVGSAAAVTSLDSFQALFAEGFGLKGVLPLAEAVTALAQDKFGTTVSLVMLIGFLCNLLVAKFIAQPYMRKVTGDDELAMGHYVTVGYALSGWIGSKVGKPEDSTENLNLPGWLTMFKDYVVGVSITMIIFFYIAAIAAGKGAVEELSGGVNWLVYPLFQGLGFSAALYVIITGVRLFLGEIVSAFVGISEKLIPNARPALDCPVVFPFAPTATVIGFLAAYAGGLVTMVVMGLIGTIVIIPVAVPYFFIGATAGVFGNATGGWKGCVAGSFVVGILIAVGPALIYPIMENIGLTGTSFPETDFNIVGLLVYYIGQLLQSVF